MRTVHGAPTVSGSPFNIARSAIRLMPFAHSNITVQRGVSRNSPDELSARGRGCRRKKPSRNEDRVKLLLGLMWSGAKAEELRAGASQLLADQRPDGGWAQRAGFSSDAYATGQSLYTLHQAAGIASKDPAFLRGVSFLRRTQLEDGSWHVRSRSLKFQPYFESGFPHGHDQWISSAASAWAAMALTLAAEESAIGERANRR